MVCIVEFEAGKRFNFVQDKHKQKIWIEALQHCFDKNISQLAWLLDISPDILDKVHQGYLYLSESEANKLGQLFLIAFSD